MKVRRVLVGGVPGYRWGTVGRVHAYEPHDAAGRARARDAAARDGAVLLDLRRSNNPREVLDATRASMVRRSSALAKHEASYRAVAMRVARDGLEAIRPFLREAVDALRGIAKADSRADALPGQDAALAALGRALAFLRYTWSPDLTGLDGVGREVADRSLKGVRDNVAASSASPSSRAARIASLEVAAGPMRKEALRAWTATNTGLIRTLPERAVLRMQKVMAREFPTGLDVGALAKRIEATFGDELSASVRNVEAHARLLARDQTAKLNSQIAERGMRQAGATRYRWMTVGDEAVRSMHRDLNGGVFSWTDPPVTNEAGDRNHPGEDYQCRCVALPEFDELPDDGDAVQLDSVAGRRDAPSFVPPSSVRAAAARGLALRAEVAPSRRGGTAVGLARARDLANGRPVSVEVLRRMRSFFARHEVDKAGQGFNRGEPGYPSKGLQAWLLWGGDPGRAWAERMLRRIEPDG